MVTRREFLNVAAAGAAGLLAPWNRAQAGAPIDGSQLAKYVDALPIPGVLSPTTPRGSHYRVEISEFSQQLHRDLPETIVWGYNGSYPGPTIEARKNKPITVEWVNNLIDPKLQLPLDTTIEESPATLPRARVVPHLHGGHILSAWDGIPDAWFTSGSSPVTGPGFYGTTFEYANDQQAATLWYHDHAAGVTRLNVYAGLAGFYLIRDAIEKSLNLPSGPFEIPLVIQDRMFDASGQLFYPDQGVTSKHPIWVPNVFGNIALVNGKVWPYLEVEPRKYRFRILNGSNSRFYNLSLTSKQPLTQIGSDGGLLARAGDTRQATDRARGARRRDCRFRGLCGPIYRADQRRPRPLPAWRDDVPPRDHAISRDPAAFGEGHHLVAEEVAGVPAAQPQFGDERSEPDP
jgi:spore coat protein A, manganese oxidase